MKTFAYLLLLLLCSTSCLMAQQSEQPQSYTQTIRGVIADKSVSIPLDSTEIIVTGENKNYYTYSDEEGKFKLENIPVGRYEIRIQKPGYKPVVLANQLINSGKETVLEIYLEEEIIQIEEIIVNGSKDKAKSNNNLVTNSYVNLRPEEINRFAGSRSDPSRMASNYAGVAGGGDQRNDIIVRGNSPIGVLWRLEGVDIPNPNHFTSPGSSGGAFSILNNNLLASSDFITGAFPAEYGNKTGAVFDVKMRNGNNEKRENTFQIGLNGIELSTEGPIQKNQGSSYLASYRFLTLAPLKAIGVDYGANGIPQYQDFSMKVNLPTPKFGTFSLWGIYGKSTINMLEEIEDKDSVYNPTVRYESAYATTMFAAGLANEHHYGKKTKGNFILSTSGNQLTWNENDVRENGDFFSSSSFSNEEYKYLATYSISHKFSRKHYIKVGVIASNINYGNKETYYDYDDSTNYNTLNQSGNSWLTQAYIHWRYRVGSRVNVNTGLYYQYFKLSNSHAIEPRLAIDYMVNENNNIGISAGLHSQNLPLFIYQYKFYDKNTSTYYQPNLNLDFMKSIHVVASYKRTITENIRFKTEVYYQYMYQVPVSTSSNEFYSIYSVVNTGATYGFYAPDSAANNGKGNNYGVEFTLEKYFHKGYYFLTNVSLLKSTYLAGDGKWRSTAFDIGHVYNVLGGKEFHLDNVNRKVLSIDFKLTHSGGRKTIPIDEEASIIANEAKYDFDNAYSIKLKDYFRTDLKITYAVNRKKASHNLFIAADNLFNTKNILDHYWDAEEKKTVYEYQIGIFPYLGYRVQF